MDKVLFFTISIQSILVFVLLAVIFIMAAISRNNKYKQDVIDRQNKIKELNDEKDNLDNDADNLDDRFDAIDKFFE